MRSRRRYAPPDALLHLSLSEIGRELDLSPADVKNLLRHKNPALTKARRVRAAGSAKVTITRSALEALKESRGYGRRTKPDPVNGDWLTPYERKTL